MNDGIWDKNAEATDEAGRILSAWCQAYELVRAQPCPVSPAERGYIRRAAEIGTMRHVANLQERFVDDIRRCLRRGWPISVRRAIDHVKDAGVVPHAPPRPRPVPVVAVLTNAEILQLFGWIPPELAAREDPPVDVTKPALDRVEGAMRTWSL